MIVLVSDELAPIIALIQADLANIGIGLRCATASKCTSYRSLLTKTNDNIGFRCATASKCTIYISDVLDEIGQPQKTKLSLRSFKNLEKLLSIFIGHTAFKQTLGPHHPMLCRLFCNCVPSVGLTLFLFLMAIKNLLLRTSMLLSILSLRDSSLRTLDHRLFFVFLVMVLRRSHLNQLLSPSVAMSAWFPSMFWRILSVASKSSLP